MVDDAEKENRGFDRPGRVTFLIDYVDAVKEETIVSQVNRPILHRFFSQ
jgi:hypothetical protein